MELPIGEKFELWKWQRTHLALNTLQSTQLDAYALNDELFSILQQSLNTALNPLMVNLLIQFHSKQSN